MNSAHLISHRHTPIYRVVRRGWQYPLDASYSQRKTDNWWNTRAFPALYTCCSVRVARAVALDKFRFSAVLAEDLQPDQRPDLVEVTWSGRVVDVATGPGVAAAGFPNDYPRGVSKSMTRDLATKWHAANREGVVCRSASMYRQGYTTWNGPHQRWSEGAIFTNNVRFQPRLLGRTSDLTWLFPRRR
jgi:hypothetical protein